MNSPTAACKHRIQQIEQALGKRRLLWFGVRGSDAVSLKALAQFDGAFSIIAPLEMGQEDDRCLETLSHKRVDLDVYDIDADKSPDLERLRRRLYDALDGPTAIAAYRPSRFLSSVHFPRMRNTHYLGLFHERQAPFEHKPWVETELSRHGVPMLDWQYYPDHDRRLLREAVGKTPMVIRASRSDGGAGIVLANDPKDLERIAPRHNDSFLAACRFYPEAIPLNLNACVYPNGEVALHAASIQIIGHPDLTTRKFGYCGNDFGAIRDLPNQHIEAFEQHTKTIGNWLAKHGYRGAFGVDALLDEKSGDFRIVEINPRFQGSTCAAATIDRSLGQADMFLNHIAAFLDLPPPESVSLTELVAQQPALSLIVFHNCSDSDMHLDSMEIVNPLLQQIDSVATPGTAVAPGAVLARALVTTSVYIGEIEPRSIAPGLCPVEIIRSGNTTKHKLRTYRQLSQPVVESETKAGIPR